MSQLLCKNKNSTKQTRGKVHYCSALPDGQIRRGKMVKLNLLNLCCKGRVIAWFKCSKSWWVASDGEVEWRSLGSIFELLEILTSPFIKANWKWETLKKNWGLCRKFKTPQLKGVPIFHRNRLSDTSVASQLKGLLITWSWGLVKELKLVVCLP